MTKTRRIRVFVKFVCGNCKGTKLIWLNDAKAEVSLRPRDNIRDQSMADELMKISTNCAGVVGCFWKKRATQLSSSLLIPRP